MSDIAIKIENLSKQYRLGVVGTGTLSHDLKRWWTVNVRGMEDPYLKIGETNDRSVRGNSEYVWALKDINLDIKQGDVVGIVGRNGAGKSTLLKILSKVTKPTTGTVQYKGRIASLLEVGTGFHPEMTGRENIYMNGSIMGMSKSEITRKLDEIVTFAGVERFIETPVKRYSSGMTVRLGFAIAAHLEPEILVVDEVLAVGDTEFQKKAIGKMQDVSKGDGRTVLFVSHNMQAVNTLCKTGIFLNNGNVMAVDSATQIVRLYNEENETSFTRWSGSEGDDNARLLETLIDLNDGDLFTDMPVTVNITYQVIKPTKNLVVGFHLKSEYDYELAYTIKGDYDISISSTAEPGIYTETFIIPPYSLTKGNYYVRIDFGIHDVKFITRGKGDLKFYMMNRNTTGCRFPVIDTKGYASLFRPAWHSKTHHHE